MARMGLTAQQQKLKDYLAGYISERGGVAPSFEEMLLAMGLKSKAGIHRILIALEERGHIQRLKNRARAIKILDGADK